MSSPKISVLMTVYNGERFIRESVASILGQTFSDFEFLIVDDGSTDKTVDIIKSFNDNRIVLINNTQNLGIIKSLNKAIELIKGEYCARMDSDDIAEPSRFEKEIIILDKMPNVAVVTSHVTLINDKGEDAGLWAEDMEAITNKEIYRLLPHRNCIANPAAMIRSSVFKKYKYNTGQKDSEDWDLWLTMASDNLGFYKIPETLVKYRIHDAGTTVKSNKGGILKRIARFKYVYLKTKISKFKLKGTDYKVLSSYITDLTRCYFPFIYALAGKLYSTNPFRFISQYSQISKQFNGRKPISHIFLFPFTHVGGAEKVHASILETVADKSPVALITNRSTSTALPEFEKNATVINVSQLLIWPFSKKWLTNKICATIQSNKQLCLFSSNSKYYYELLAKVPDGTKAIDLIHAFVHSYEDGPEKWSLPIIDKLTKRVVINRQTANDLEKFYARNNISQKFTERIVCINNFTVHKEKIQKDTSGKLKVLYVGRGTAEKRVEIISRVSRVLGEKKANIEFHFVGALTNAVPKEDAPYCILHCEIRDAAALDKLYEKSHILLITSSREGFPMVIMEAMMNGVVPISTNVGGISEHIKTEVNGILLKNISADEVVNELVTVLEHFISNRDELNAISTN
ncbi:MAG TPA: glycosyltransferase, partial [Bacteroidia bacterium]|nr:glycosyltransferase [Bacteroidia bacterium]